MLTGYYHPILMCHSIITTHNVAHQSIICGTIVPNFAPYRRYNHPNLLLLSPHLMWHNLLLLSPPSNVAHQSIIPHHTALSSNPNVEHQSILPHTTYMRYNHTNLPLLSTHIYVIMNHITFQILCHIL